jgi:hypothetical protein
LLISDNDLGQEAPCIWSTIVRTTSSEPTVEELKLILLNASGENLLPFKNATAAFHFTDQSNEAVRSVVGNNLPLLECYFAKLSQLNDLLAHHAGVGKVLSDISQLTVELLRSSAGREAVKEHCSKSGMDFDHLVNGINLDTGMENATLTALKFICNFKEILIGLLANPVFSDVTFAHSTLSLCTEFFSIANKIEIARQAAVQSRSLHASQFCPRLHFLKKSLSSVKLHSSSAKELQKTLVTKLDAWIDSRKKRTPYAEAQYMDPRCKTTMHLQDPLANSQIQQDLRKTLLHMISSDANEAEENEESDEGVDNVEEPDESMDIVNCFDLADFCPSGTTSSNHSKGDVESSYLSSFLNDPALQPAGIDVGRFWADRAKAEPWLAKMAVQKLAFPGFRPTHISKFANSKLFWKQSLSDIQDYMLLATLSSKLWDM